MPFYMSYCFPSLSIIHDLLDSKAKPIDILAKSIHISYVILEKLISSKMLKDKFCELKKNKQKTINSSIHFLADKFVLNFNCHWPMM